MIATIRKQWRDWFEVTSNEDPIKRWAWPAVPKDWNDARWLQIDIWVTPGRLVGLDLSRDFQGDSYSDTSSHALTITVACLSLVVSVETYKSRPPRDTFTVDLAATREWRKRSQL